MAKKTITIEIDEDAFNGLNNAVAAYLDILFAIKLCCDVPDKFRPLKDKSEEELDARRDAVMQLYRDVEKQFLN
jgi:hypothetical protein